MSTLGVGVPVFVGWVPPHKRRTGNERVGATGVLVDGPFNAGERIPEPWKTNDGKIIRLGPGAPPAWIVRMDVDGATQMASETFLHPIDDGDPEAVPEDRELEVEA